MQTRPQEEGKDNPTASEIVGIGTVYESAFAPARWRLSLQVHPDHRHRGIGSALLSDLTAIAAARDTRSLQVGLRADAQASLGFFTHHGFRHLMRTRLGTLDPVSIPTRSHPPPIASERLTGSARPVSPGRPQPLSTRYRIAPLPALTHLRDITLTIATLHAEIYRQTHAWSPPVPITPHEAIAAFLGPDLIPDAIFIASLDETPIGVASLRHGLTPGEIDLGWTGVLTTHADIAPDLTAALLHHCLTDARELGWTIRVEVDEADPILWKLLDTLPVSWEPDWINLVRLAIPSTRP